MTLKIVPPCKTNVRIFSRSADENCGFLEAEMYRIGASCHSLTSDFSVMICQLTWVSKVRLTQRVRLAASRGRLFQSPLNSSLLRKIGWRPRTRNRISHEVLGMLP